MSSSNDSDSDCVLLTPEDISETKNVIHNSSKSKKIYYLKAYDNFVKWKNSKGFKSFSEPVFLAYFQELSKTEQPSTLWSTYSMLKYTVSTKNDITIATYTKLIAYLKRISKGYNSRKSKVLSRQNVETFLNEAPDQDFLATKVALIFGVHGACSVNELLKISVDDIEKHSDQLLLVNLTDTKTKQDRSFIIRGENKNIVEKYQNLRPPNTGTKRFFIHYQNGKCYKQVIGNYRISCMPQEIASYLKLPDIKLYTAHCFRKTSATFLAAGSGAGGRRSSTTSSIESIE